MKPSRYNLFIPTEHKGQYILYNTLGGATYMVADEARTAIQNFVEGQISDDYIQDLKKEGILVEDYVDERAIFKAQRDQTKYCSSSAAFTVFTTYRCNAACVSCYERYMWGDATPDQSMDEDISNRVVRFIKNTVVENSYSEFSVILNGGEPTLNIDWDLWILKTIDSWAREKGCHFRAGMLTNGTLLTKELIDEFMRYDTTLQITLEGPPEIHDQKRVYEDNSGTYDDIVRTLELLKQSKQNVNIRVNVDKENYPHMERCLDELRERIGEGWFVRFFRTIPGAKVKDSSYESCFEVEQLAPRLPKLWNLATERGFNVVLRPLRNYAFCDYSAEHSYSIDPLGDVYKCEGLVGLQDHRIGTLDETGRPSEKTYAYYDWMSMDPFAMQGCSECVYLPMCGGGGCSAIAYDKYGTYHRAACPLERYTLAEQIRFIVKKTYPEKLKGPDKHDE